MFLCFVNLLYFHSHNKDIKLLSYSTNHKKHDQFLKNQLIYVNRNPHI